MDEVGLGVAGVRFGGILAFVGDVSGGPAKF
jgi:hypothetical protein